MTDSLAVEGGLTVGEERTRRHSTDSGLDSVGDWANARRWQEIQPLLLDEPGLVETLAEGLTVTRTLGDSSYAISRPEPPIDWTPPSDTGHVPSDLEISEPSERSIRDRLSATVFRDRLNTAPTRPEIFRTSADESTDRQPINDDLTAINALDDATIGTLVHRLCELQPPKSEWPAVIRREVDDPGVLTTPIIDAIIAHAEAGINGLEVLESDHQIKSRHSELSVTLDLERLTVRGDIDHLSVTENGYLVVDYKTSDLSAQSIDRLTEHYLSQLLVYGGALWQADEEATEFTTALVFTDTGACRSRTFTRDDVEMLLGWAEEIL